MYSKRSSLQAALALTGAAALGHAAHAQDKTIKIGVTAGPHAQIMERVKQVAAKDGLKIDIVEFSDYVQPNAALASGDLDANSYQHKPYLDAQIKDRGYKFTVAANTVTFPIGLYSRKIKKLASSRKARASASRTTRPTAGACCCCCSRRASSSSRTARA